MNRTLLDFVDNVISHDADSVQSLMANLNKMVSPSDSPIFEVSDLL